jgi:hypothetical protein
MWIGRFSRRFCPVPERFRLGLREREAAPKTPP